jgi:hypothetical protein
MKNQTCFIQVLWLVLAIIEAGCWLWFWSRFGFCFDSKFWTIQVPNEWLEPTSQKVRIEQHYSDLPCLL